MDIIKEYIKLLIVDFELDEQELLNVWLKAHPEKPVVAIQDSDEKVLLKMKKPQLQGMCKDRNINQNGTKEDLINRLLNRVGEKKEKKEKVEKNPTAKKSTKKSTKSVPPVLNAVFNTITTVKIRRNDFGNYEDVNTRFVFDPTTNMVIGKQNPSGSIDPLVASDIEQCMELKYLYKLPLNLE